MTKYGNHQCALRQKTNNISTPNQTWYNMFNILLPLNKLSLNFQRQLSYIPSIS